MLMSSICPCPLLSRSCRALRMPMAVYSPAAMSPREMPGRTGGPSGSPVMLMMPPIPWTTMSSAGRSRSGPVCPKPDVAA